VNEFDSRYEQFDLVDPHHRRRCAVLYDGSAQSGGLSDPVCKRA
jgi:hypothetical protein